MPDETVFKDEPVKISFKHMCNMCKNLSFACIPIETKEKRLKYEALLIKTLSSDNDFKPSESWLGNYSPIEKIKNSGLWLVNELAINKKHSFKDNITIHGNFEKSNIKFMTYAIGMVAEQNKRKDINGYKIMNNEMANIKFVVPPLNIQTIIANFLDKKCSEIDSLSADIQSQIDVLEEYKKSVITEAVTKGLNPEVEMKNSGIEWVQQMPKHWVVMPNKFVMKKEKVLCPKYSGEDILSLTMNGVIVRDLDAGGKMPASFDGYQIVRPNNLLMCLFDYDVTPRCIGLIKNHGLTSPAYSQFVMKNGNSERYYYYYYLMIDNTKELLHLAKNLRHSFTEEQLGMINTPVPPINEQIAIAEYLDEIIKETDKVIADKKAQLETIAEYKKSLIYEYVTGKKEV